MLMDIVYVIILYIILMFILMIYYSKQSPSKNYILGKGRPGEGRQGGKGR